MLMAERSYVVFGAGSGLGRATAIALARSGASVVASDLSDERLQETAALLGASGRCLRADVSDVAQVRAVLALAQACEAPLRGVVNTAGVLHGERVLGRTGMHDPLAFEKVLKVNLLGSFHVLACAAEAMAKNSPDADGERGIVVNTASIAAFDGQAGQLAYAASKAGVAGMTLPAARDLARHGIRVVGIAPGIFATPMVDRLPPAAREALEGIAPFPRRAGRPEEYADLVCHVIGNRMINGEVIRLDGALRMPA